ncbi:MAG TPA: tetratricopeptide repeat protein, partial [Gammaproteobacteria bacterium]|nr:tetratricopeptide repeat protein [Gammaproteobacteria bacterium]
MAVVFRRILTAFLLAFPFLPDARAASSPSGEFQAGIRAFKAERFEAALSHFRAARASGMDKPSLDYNLGVTYYRLGRYRLARKAFHRLLEYPGSAPLAHYNLGLVARKLNHPDTAESHFRTAYRTAEDPKVRHLAANRLPNRQESASGPRFTGLVSLGWGYSDNVTLEPDNGPVTSGRGDQFLQALAAGTFQMLGDYADGVQLKASLLRLDYSRR